MEILDNARIVRELTFKGEWSSIWGYVEGLIKRIEISEKRCNCQLLLNKDCEHCEDDCGWYAGGLKTIDIDQIETEFDRFWRKGIETVDLDALSKWLIDDSKDKSELSFRLDKIKGIVGDMWSNDDIAQINMLLTGSKDNGEPALRPNGTPLGSILTRSITVITRLGREPVESIKEKVGKLNMILSSRVHDIQFIISIMNDIINEAERILNPNTNCASIQDNPIKLIQEKEDKQDSTESTYRIDNNQSKIKKDTSPNKEFLPNEYFTKAMDLCIKEGFAERSGEIYHWKAKRDLLAYFCIQFYEKIGCEVDKIKVDRRWKYFENWFIGLYKGNVKVFDSKILKTGYDNFYSNSSGRERGRDEFKPRNRDQVDKIIDKIADKLADINNTLPFSIIPH